MSRLRDPHLAGMVPGARTPTRIGDLDVRLSARERGGGGGGGGGSATDPNALHRTLFLAKGDILVATGPSTVVRLAAPPLDGSTDGWVLTIDHTTATGLAWAAVSVVPAPTYTIQNHLTDRAFDCNATTIHELADVLGTLIDDFPLPLPTYTITNPPAVADRAYDADATTIHELADVLGTVITDLIAGGGPGGWNVTNYAPRRDMDAHLVTVHIFADVLGTLIADLKASGDLTP